MLRVQFHDENDDDPEQESIPLTPRESDASSRSSAQSRSTYLSFFKSPIVPPSNTNGRLPRAPLYPVAENTTAASYRSRQSTDSEASYAVRQFGDEEAGYRSNADDDSASVFRSVDSTTSPPLSTTSSSNISTATHLYGEHLVKSSSDLLYEQDGYYSGSTMKTPSTNASRRVSTQSSSMQHVGWIRNLVARPSMSPRSRNLHDLSYLIHEHRHKMQQFLPPLTDHYDFCLILQPQEAYGFWAQLLDFRAEILGPESVQCMDELTTRRQYSTDETFSVTSSDGSSAREMDRDEAKDVTYPLPYMATTTPSTLRRRTTPDRSQLESSTPVMRSRTMTMTSPGIYSIVSRMSAGARRSVFERALGSPEQEMTLDDRLAGCHPTQQTPGTALRRRWGNQAAGHNATASMISPPIRSLTRGVSTTQRTKVPQVQQQQQTQRAADNHDDTNQPTNPNILTMEDIPPQRFARGIAARTNGMLPFLSALKRGIVVRKHRPGQEAILCKLQSDDGGDTIRFVVLSEAEAFNALKEQRVKFNKVKYDGHDDPMVQSWSLPAPEETKGDENNFSMPDYVAAEHYRDKMSKERAVGKRVVELAAQVVRSGVIKAADIAVIHPGVFTDPRATSNEIGTSTFRRSKSEYNPQLSFSLVMRTDRFLGRANPVSIDEYENRWLTGCGNETQFKYHDFEAASLGEYWLAFRGFLLLHRDAAVGRFAEHRAAGIGSHYNRLELEQREDVENILHQDEFHEPKTVGCLERFIVKLRDIDTTYMEGYTLPGAVPPPSDYFLGFKSPGTAIWSRLRLSGLETSRVYSLDPNRVMIKIRCPPERLMDVAEVLRVKLKTRDGSFAPFREDMLDLYQMADDPLEALPHMEKMPVFPFRSSIRQTIVNFIVGSRIRDSGAELSQNTDLGKMIRARVPLHMHEKLNAIYYSWFYFWRPENWNRRDGTSMVHTSMPDPDDEWPHKGDEQPVIPGLWKRVVVGCMYQPLDSIEQYFGEKVAFYFAWLQHTAGHLIFLSAAGLILFMFQLGTDNWDHPLRPFFAILVMLWTFVVLINWKKRANFLAYRWGTMNYKEQETTRPQFTGNYTRDDVTGEWVVTYPNWKRWLKYTISLPLTLLFTGGSLFLIFWVHANRDLQLANYMEKRNNSGSESFELDFAIDAIGRRAPIVEFKVKSEYLSDPSFWIIVVGLPSMLGLFLPLVNLILMKISVMLNNFENYRTESEYRTWLIVKVFSFRFVCYFATLYYYAFVSIGSDQALKNGTLRVATGVLVYTTVAQWWQSFLALCFPIAIRRVRMTHRKNRLCDELRAIEIEEEQISAIEQSDGIDDELRARQIHLVNKRLLLEQAQDELWLEVMLPQHDSFPEYIQAVVQFTYVSCFSVALPITPAIVLFNYLLCMRLDAYKLCKGRRRPLAEKTGGIGVWEHLLHIVAVISVLTNCWLVGFTTAMFTSIGDKIGEVGLFAIVVGWEHVMLLIKYVMQNSISPLPKCVLDAMKREQHELDQQRSASMQARRLQHQREEDELQHIRKESLQSSRMDSPMSHAPVPKEDYTDDTA